MASTTQREVLAKMTYNTVLYQFIEGIAEEFARLHFQATELLNEKSTLSTYDLIGRHEKDFGLPNDYFEIESTIPLRRGTLNALLTTIGRLDKAYYIEVAEDLTHDVSIVEFRPCICGVCECGNNNVGSVAVIHYWGAIVYYNHTMVTPAEGYTIPNLSNLISFYNRYKPGHTIVLWSFYGPEYNNAFDFSFNSMPPNAVSSTWDGGFEHDAFSTAFDRDYGYKLPCYFGGAFSLGFNNSFNNYIYIENISSYFGGPYDSAFSKAFDTSYTAIAS